MSAALSFLWRGIERRLARVLGMDVALARDVVATARHRGDGGLLLRCAAFCAATTRVAPRVAPRALRERVIDSAMTRLLKHQIWEPHAAFAYAGRPRRLMSP